MGIFVGELLVYQRVSGSAGVPDFYSRFLLEEMASEHELFLVFFFGCFQK